MQDKYIVVPAWSSGGSLRLPQMWAEFVFSVEEAEEIAKELALKHSKVYTVLCVHSTFKPDYSVKKGK